ncbi:MAG: glycosyltransferase family 4 protein [Chitinophagales bacterium]|nr:glycosyltransferase family 4 protein [Chitinophagales bacterium]
MRNVLIDMHRLKHNPYNGLYTFSENLGNALVKNNPNDLQLYFYSPKEKFGIFGEKESYVPHHSKDKFYMFGTNKYDVWHITTQISWYKPFNKKTKIIYTIHDLNFLIEDKENFKRNKRLLKLIQSRINRAHFITAISQYTMNCIEDHLQLHNKPRAIIYNGCNIAVNKNINATKYKPSVPFLFSIGLVQPRKNFHVLPALLKNNNMELIIAGLNNFSYKDEVLAAAKKFGVENRVILIGPVDNDEKQWYYKNCEAFVFPSYAEGFGLPVIEAMYYGKPVFLSKLASLPEIGGKCAYYFDNFEPTIMQKNFEDGMNDYYLRNPQKEIIQQAEKFNWNDVAKQYINIYQTI